MSYYMVHYRISDPKGFWSGVQDKISDIPNDFKMLCSAPNKAGTEAMTLWQGGERDSLQTFLKKSAGSTANYEVMELDSDKFFRRWAEN